MNQKNELDDLVILLVEKQPNSGTIYTQISQSIFFPQGFAYIYALQRGIYAGLEELSFWFTGISFKRIKGNPAYFFIRTGYFLSSGLNWLKNLLVPGRLPVSKSNSEYFPTDFEIIPSIK